MDAALKQPASGQWIGEFEVLEKIRRGGMATLYRARRYGASGFSREIALKVLHEDLACDQRFLTMFVDEARISSRLSHPNVVRVEELGADGGVHFLAMEYIAGCSVNDLLKLVRRSRRLIAPDLAAHIGIRIAEGLHAAHQACDDNGESLQLIHRDISPSNILLSKSGHVKVIDFGIAKANGRLGATQTGYSLKGKLRYMAPEQAMGDELDRRADIYALGVVLWELLAGRQLFNANTEVELFERITNPQVVPPSHYNTAVPTALDNLVLSMLSLDRTKRPATAAHVAQHLRAASPAMFPCDAQTVATVVSAVLAGDASGAPTLGSNFQTGIKRVPEIHTPSPIGWKPKSAGGFQYGPHQHQQRRGRGVSTLLGIALCGALTFAALVAGVWISRWVTPAQPAVAPAVSISPSGDKTDGKSSHPEPTTPEGEILVKKLPVASVANTVVAKKVSKPAIKRRHVAKTRPRPVRHARIAADFDDPAPRAKHKRARAKATKIGKVPVATSFD